MDLSDVIHDPDFCETVSIELTTANVNDYGRVEFTSSLISRECAIQPATPDDMDLLPDDMRNSETLAIWTDENIESDWYVLRNGNRYCVKPIETWKGVTKALAVKEAIQ